MNFRDYALSEMAIANLAEPVQQTVLDLLKPVDKQDHSGGSMGIFSGWARAWAKDPQEITDEGSMLYPLWLVVEDLAYEDRKVALDTLSKVMTFTPLTLLTGEDDEWVCHDYDADVYYQNKRCSRIFKRSDGKAYNIDGRVFYEPSYGRGWSGFTNRASRVYIEFPYDASTEPERVYYADRNRTFILPKEIDPESWIAHKNRVSLSGYMDNGSLDYDVVVMTEAECSATLDAYRLQMPSPGKLDWTDFPSGWEIEDSAAGTEANHQAYLKLARVSRVKAITDPAGVLLDNGNYRFSDGIEYTLSACQVMVPAPFYKKWIPKLSDAQELVYAIAFCRGDDDKFYIDGTPCQHIGCDPDDYLYAKRREYGYAHPPRIRNNDGSVPAAGEHPAVD